MLLSANLSTGLRHHEFRWLFWTSQYKIAPSSKYAINKLECKLPANAAERIVSEAVIREKMKKMIM
jgi:hypothetical protein